MKAFSIVPCLGLCAICEVVMWYLNTNLTYSEDGGKMGPMESTDALFRKMFYADKDWSIYTDKQLLAMLRETERVGFEEDKPFCYAIRKELSDRWKREADRKYAKTT